MAEGTSLLRMHTAYTCIVGSNPTVSARTPKTRFGGVFHLGPLIAEAAAIPLASIPATTAVGAIPSDAQQGATGLQLIKGYMDLFEHAPLLATWSPRS